MKNLVKSQEDTSELAKRVLSLDISHIEKEIRFFFPYEVQIVDIEAHKENSKGDASHQEYKKSQIQWVIKRVFKKLLAYKGLSSMDP